MQGFVILLYLFLEQQYMALLLNDTKCNPIEDF